VKTILTNPIYVGRPTYGDNIEVEDKTLAMIDEKMFGGAREAAEKIAARHSKGEDEYLRERIQEYGLDYVSRVTGIKPTCRRCGSVMVRSGSKTVRGLRGRQVQVRQVRTPSHRAPRRANRRAGRTEAFVLSVL